MTANAFLQLAVYLVVLLALVKPLGAYMARVFDGPPVLLEGALGPLERGLYRAAGVDPNQGMSWRTYTVAMLLFNLVGLLAVYALQRLQGVLPLNPQGLAAVSADSSFNTAVSFATNTNWQGYGGESTMSYLTQMLALTVQRRLSRQQLLLELGDRVGNGRIGVVDRGLIVIVVLSERGHAHRGEHNNDDPGGPAEPNTLHYMIRGAHHLAFLTSKIG